MSRTRRLRVAALVSILAWFVLPELRDVIPIWLPFLGVVALEAHFLVAGLREGPAPRSRRGRAPQEVDLRDFGGDAWLEPVLVEIDGRDVWLPATGKTDEELQELIEEARERMRRGEPPVEPPPLRPRPPQPLWTRLEGLVVVAAAAVLLFVLLPDRGWSGLDASDQVRTEELLSESAAQIAGHEVDVRCDAEGKAVGVVQHADGIAEVGGRNALLTPAICYRLYRLAFADDEGPFSQTARAIAVLAHEAWHLRGVGNEGVANCYAFQSGVDLGRRLGLSEGTAARMMRQQLVDNATFARSAPAYLVPGECRNGGDLDLHPARDRFP